MKNFKLSRYLTMTAVATVLLAATTFTSCEKDSTTPPAAPPTDAELAVAAQAATGISKTAATLHGSYDSTYSEYIADTGFDYRKSGETSWVKVWLGSSAATFEHTLAELYGKESGFCHGRGGSMHIADFSVGMLGANGVVGGGYNLATGAALASKMILKNDRVSVVFFGDGASNRGTFHEAMNVASAWKLPVIFVNEMNCWASTTPYRTTCNVENISDRAAGYHVPGVIVDGQDVFAVYEAAKEAVARARAGEGPTFIEAKTYRIEGHFVGDPELYRDHAETQKIYHDTDPLKMFRAKAAKLKLMTAEECDAIDAKCEQKIKDAKEYAMQSEYADASEYMKYVYVDD